MGDTWLQHATELLSSNNLQGGGVYDLQGNPWAEKVSGFQVEQHEVALIARGFDNLEQQQAKAQADAQRAAQEVANVLAAGTTVPDLPLSVLCGHTDVLDEIRRAATETVANPELQQMVPQIESFTNAHFAGHEFFYVCGNTREMYFRRGSAGVACAKSLTGVIVAFHDEEQHRAGDCRSATSRAADALRDLGL